MLDGIMCKAYVLILMSIGYAIALDGYPEQAQDRFALTPNLLLSCIFTVLADKHFLILVENVDS